MSEPRREALKRVPTVKALTVRLGTFNDVWWDRFLDELDVALDPKVVPVEPNEAYMRSLDEWWTDGAMVNFGHSGDEGFVGDAATPDDATRIVEAHNTVLAALSAEGGRDE